MISARRIVMYAIYEVGIVVGIGLAYLTIPRKFPLSWFIAIAVGTFVIFNVSLLNALKDKVKAQPDEATRNPGIKRMMSKRMYVALALVALYVVLKLLWHV